MSWTFRWFDRVTVNGNSISGHTNAFNLTSGRFKVILRSFIGDTPPFRNINDPVPLRPGSFLKFVDTEENEVDLTLLIQADDSLSTESARIKDLYDIIGGSQTNNVSLPKLFDPTKRDKVVTLTSPANAQRTLTGNGKLRVTTPSGNIRDLICRCISGFQIRSQDLQMYAAFCPLTFLANQPYWRKSTTDSFEITNASDTPDFLDKNIIPIVGADVTFDFVKKVTNNGDVETPIRWTITGPGRNPVLINHTTKETISFSNLTIGRRQRLLINTERKTVRISGGESKLRHVDVDSQFWNLVTGENTIEVRLSGTVNDDTKFAASYHERFLGVY